ncbi:MAG: pirin family protein [Pirellulales bacterium]|nr:pirin family protein [Pirellulales bacterium]
MLQLRRSNERGHYDHGWLNTYHTFSFGEYHDPKFMGFRPLRVMNEDCVSPGEGFGTHPHRDMEIVSYVLEGALEHRDSMGNGEVLSPGEFQRNTAGTGITHSEFNPSAKDLLHFYQIWLFPEKKGLPPSYEQKGFPVEERLNRLCLVAAPDGADGALMIHQDARIFLSQLEAGQSLEHPIAAGRYAWLQVLRGQVTANGEALTTSDGAAVSDERALRITAEAPAEIMLFDLA